MNFKFSYIFFFLAFSFNSLSASDSTRLSNLFLVKTITGKISPKSIVHNGNGLFFAQNMMYRHTVTVYNRDFELIKSIKDKVLLSKHEEDTSFHSKEFHRGAPVECVFSNNGKYAWVSNYEMTGKGFNKPGCDNCNSKSGYDQSFVYKINTENFNIENVIKVGSVPKYLAATQNNKYVLVSNWTSGDVSIIDTELNLEIKRVPVGRFPRGIVIDNTKNVAYIAIMGGKSIAKINLNDFSKTYFDVGEHPRHICIDEFAQTLFVTLNGEGKVAKVNLTTMKIEKIRTGRLPRSMDYCDYNKSLYIVNYGSKFLTKVDAETFKVTDTIVTNSKPIGVTIDKDKGEIWVACYSGSIMIIKDRNYKLAPQMGPENMDLSFLFDSKPVITTPTPTKPTTDIKSKPKSVIKEVAKPIHSYQIIVGSFSVKKNAERLSKTLTKEYKNCNYFKHSNGNYYVTINGFDSRDDAKTFVNAEKSKSTDFNGWILMR